MIFFTDEKNIFIEFFNEENNKQKIKIKVGLSTKIGNKIEN